MSSNLAVTGDEKHPDCSAGCAGGDAAAGHAVIGRSVKRLEDPPLLNGAVDSSPTSSYRGCCT